MSMMEIKVTDVTQNVDTQDISVVFTGKLNLHALAHLKLKTGDSAFAALGQELAVQLEKSLDTEYHE